MTVSVSVVCVLGYLGLSSALKVLLFCSKDEVKKKTFFGIYFKNLATFSLEKSRDFALKEEMCVM